MTEVQHQPERKTRPAGLLEDIESIQDSEMLSAFDIFNLKRALKALGYYDGRVNKKMDNDLKYAITLFQLEHRLIMTREDAQAGQWNEPLKYKLVSVLDRETEKAPEAPARSRNAVDPNDPAAVQVTTRGKIGNKLKGIGMATIGKGWAWGKENADPAATPATPTPVSIPHTSSTPVVAPELQSKSKKRKAIDFLKNAKDRIKFAGGKRSKDGNLSSRIYRAEDHYTDEEIRQEIFDYLCYRDTANELSDAVPEQKKEKEKYETADAVDDVINWSPNAKSYAACLKTMMRVYGEKKVVKKIDELRARCQEALEAFCIPNSRYGRSRTWAAWDMAKQLHYAFDEKGIEQRGEDQSGKKYYNTFAEVYEPGNAMEDRELQGEILQRHVGWEVWNYFWNVKKIGEHVALSAPGTDKLKLIEDQLRIAFADTRLFAVQEDGIISFMKDRYDDGNVNQPPSYTLRYFGAGLLY